MQLSYEYQSPTIRDEYTDEWPDNLVCVPRVGDHIEGTARGHILKVVAVTLQSHHRVLITLGMDQVGVSSPVFKECVPGNQEEHTREPWNGVEN